MKNFKVLFTFGMALLILSCQKQPKFTELEGKWQRADNNRQFEEWSRVSDTKLFGFGYVLRGSDTILLEKMYLENREGVTFFTADVFENDAPVDFELKSDKSPYIFENQTHDFPKRITYSVTSDTCLFVTISDSEKLFNFDFVRAK
ncbi:MAG: hypothetical protein ACJAZ3_001721 [Sphingobacteriales bacterium]|jgi:hypothetical protein